MAGRKRRGFARKEPVRAYRRLYIIATEGARTEPAYFNMFQSREATLRIKLLDSRNKSSPEQVFDRAKKYITRQELRQGDSVWLVLDRDSWQVEVLNTIHTWCLESRFQLAVSNPWSVPALLRARL